MNQIQIQIAIVLYCFHTARFIYNSYRNFVPLFLAMLLHFQWIFISIWKKRNNFEKKKWNLDNFIVFFSFWFVCTRVSGRQFRWRKGEKKRKNLPTEKLLPRLRNSIISMEKKLNELYEVICWKWKKWQGLDKRLSRNWIDLVDF